MSKHRSIPEWLPWYRASKYKGDLTEAEKRQLDAFRMRPKHPAAMPDDLPDEVQQYIDRIQLELYVRKQRAAATRGLVFSPIGAALLLLNYKNYVVPTIWSNLGGALLLCCPWLIYWYVWRKNAEDFMPTGTPSRAAEEGIRQEWEHTYIARARSRASTDSQQDKGESVPAL